MYVQAALVAEIKKNFQLAKIVQRNFERFYFSNVITLWILF